MYPYKTTKHCLKCKHLDLHTNHNYSVCWLKCGFNRNKVDLHYKGANTCEMLN